MRQHPIPQNILDVEFKLFTKFTLREFAYLAIGIGTGGVFLYLFSKDAIPGIIAIPIFLVSSLTGVVLGLVPINGQNADKYIGNFIAAIKKPTQRVWLNETMKEKRFKLGEDEILGNKDKKDVNVVGLNIVQEDTKKEEVDPNDILEEKKEDTKVEEVQKEEEVEVKKDNNQLVLSKDNIPSLQFDIPNYDKLPGNINMWLCTTKYKPIPNVNVYLKSNDGKVLYGNKTDVNGYFLTSKIWDNGLYIVEFESSEFKFPNVQLFVDSGLSKRPIKITAF